MTLLPSLLLTILALSNLPDLVQASGPLKRTGGSMRFSEAAAPVAKRLRKSTDLDPDSFDSLPVTSTVLQFEVLFDQEMACEMNM